MQSRGALVTGLGIGLGIGAGLMYFLDPERGGRRRAVFRDKTAHVANRGGDALRAARRDLTARTSGTVARVRAAFDGRAVDDRILVERVRAHLGHLVAHPRAVEVTAIDGVVTIRGPILQAEALRLLKALERLRGVRKVINLLQEHTDAARRSRAPGRQHLARRAVLHVVACRSRRGRRHRHGPGRVRRPGAVCRGRSWPQPALVWLPAPPRVSRCVVNTQDLETGRMPGNGKEVMAMLARDLMTPDPACCTPQTTLDEVARLMVENRCGEIPVVDSWAQPIGVITDRDIVCRVVAEGRNPAAYTAESCMSQPAVTVDDATPLEQVVAKMETYQVRRLPVVDGDRLLRRDHRAGGRGTRRPGRRTGAPGAGSVARHHARAAVSPGTDTAARNVMIRNSYRRVSTL